MFCFAVLIVPIGEELLYRGYAFERLRTVAGTIAAYALTSIGFALIHGNPSALSIYILQGVILARAYQERGSLTTAITAHAVNNLFVTALVYFYFG